MNLKRIFWLFVLLVFIGTAVPQAHAHAVPEFSSPAPNAVLGESPAQISIQFNEPVVPTFSQIRLLTQSGEEVDIGPLRALDLENRMIGVEVPPLPQGAYLVSWQVLSAVDGHTTSGTYSFGVGVAAMAVSNEATLSAQISVLDAVARWLTLTAVSLLMGLFTFRLLVWNPLWRKVEREAAELAVDVRLARLGMRLGMVALALLAMALVLIFINQNQNFDLISGENFGIWLSTRFGLMWLYRFLLTAVLLFLLLLFMNVTDDGQSGLSGWQWVAGFILASGLAYSVAMVSHSAALPENSAQAVLVDFAHVLAATMWVGGLLFLALALWLARSLAAEDRTWLYLSLILNFSGLAAMAVGLLAVSGVYLAWQHVGSWTRLVGTAYGLTLLLKLGIAAITILTAGVNLLYIKPRLNRAYEHPEAPESDTAVRRSRTIVSVELVAALLILLVTGFLTDMQRGVDAPLLADAPGQTVLTQQADDLTVEVMITPALVGSNTFEIKITDDMGHAAAVDEVSARFTYLEQSLGAADADAEPMAPGLFHLEGSYISLIGDWQMEVSVRRPDTFDTFAAYRLHAGIGGNIRPIDSGARPLERAAQFMTLTSTGGTGLLLVLFALGWGFVAVKAAKTEWQLIPLLAISLVAFWLGASQLINFFTIEYTPAKFATNPFLPDVESIALGQELFAENCVPCHGELGRGDGPTAVNLYPPPADFSSGHTATHPDGDLYYWILNGVPDTQMPPFADRISNEEAWHLVNYVRRLSVQTSAANP
ncbi:MAG: copper resistance protein CopC [Anaerolineae bacterium]|nr:copper resistance protein CopC [Anaerolineae bacterium]